VIKHNIRGTDPLFRFFGEEFVVLLDSSDCEVAVSIADRVLDAIRKSSVEYQRQCLQVSVSIGQAIQAATFHIAAKLYKLPCIKVSHCLRRKERICLLPLCIYCC